MIGRILGRLRRMAGGDTAASVEAMLRLTNERGQPNVNALWRATRDLEALRLNVKMLGYALAASLEARLQAVPVEPQSAFLLDCKPCTQGDIESRWFRYWCEQLKERPRFHRRLWEYAYLMQALNGADALRPGARVLGLGAAPQPTASYLARMGAKVVLAHGPDEAVPEGRRDPLYDERLVDLPTFAAQVSRRTVEALPGGLEGFDALWSIGAICRQGSVAAGARLAREAMGALKPGGLAVHLLDFNFADDDQTIDNWSGVLFQRQHIVALAEALREDGHEVAALDFNVGFQEMDRFIDTPPFETGRTAAFDRLWRDGWQGGHLKVLIDGFACTSFGLIVRKARL